ncbi:MAG: type I-E CRISPR-associated protein Cas5/CasD [Acidobacteria bacterium]|nr:type I-E CRISPR-associated protein Cas5/CasD [Acidobacteriota bacterium]
MKTLLLRLVGPMQSWGIDSRFVMRETGLEPSKSGVVGLLCAALGKPKKDEEAEHPDYPPLSRLAGLRLGVRVDRPGVLQADYHTAGGAHLPEETTKGSWQLYGVLKAAAEPRRFDEPPRKGDLKTELSTRFYLADAAFLVGLQAMDAEDEFWLGRIQNRLKKPRWPIYLGRKSFVPSEPVWFRDPDLEQWSLLPLEKALSLHPRLVKDASPLRLVLDANPDDPVQSAEAIARKDVPTSFEQRQFTTRYVVSKFLERSLGS